MVEQNRVESGIFAGMAVEKAAPVGFNVSHETLRLIAEIDEFKGRWEALKALSPERLLALRHVATIESIGSSTEFIPSARAMSPIATAEAGKTGRARSISSRIQ